MKSSAASGVIGFPGAEDVERNATVARVDARRRCWWRRSAWRTRRQQNVVLDRAVVVRLSMRTEDIETDAVGDVTAHTGTEVEELRVIFRNARSDFRRTAAQAEVERRGSSDRSVWWPSLPRRTAPWLGLIAGDARVDVGIGAEVGALRGRQERVADRNGDGRREHARRGDDRRHRVVEYRPRL